MTIDLAKTSGVSPPPVLTVREASDLLRVNVKTIHAMLAQGLRHQRIGTRIIRIRREDLLAFGVVSV
jgi:excisionase family DNA binding protein